MDKIQNLEKEGTKILTNFLALMSYLILENPLFKYPIVKVKKVTLVLT